MTDKKQQSFKFIPGKRYVCVKSTSPGYKKGNIYVAYSNQNGYACFKGSDGYEDLCSMLVSTFKYAD